jgi:hypothetical protein
MARLERFTFVLDRQEKSLIAALAERMQRSQSDAVRYLVLNAARQLTELPPAQEKFNLPQEAKVESPTAA